MIDFCILGSGLSGSTIAKLLSSKYSIEIIDKAKGIGGRSSTKKINDTVSFDHGLQYYSLSNNEFQKYLNKFLKKKILKFWDGNHIDFTLKNKANSRKIIGVRGNNDLNKYLLKNVKKNLGREIISIKFKKTHWELFGKKFKFKAKNIIITFPFQQTKKLAKKYLNKNFLNFKVEMAPNITLLIKHKYKINFPISSIKFHNKIIAWASNENSKKRFVHNSTFWTIQASEKYSKKIINVYKKKKNYFSKQILKEFSKLMNLNFNNFKIFKIHGWKYSYNTSRLSLDSYWDPKLKIGICGDWFVGPKADSAWASANNLFKKIKKNPPK